MVKGISRQVILLRSPDAKLFEQAIFILKENSGGITDEMLLREAKGIINTDALKQKWYRLIWAFFGAAITGVAWLITIIL